MGTDIEVQGTLRARFNWGRWVVDCWACPSALTLAPWTTSMRCWDCGAESNLITWPPDPDAIETILGYRPDPNTRNWEPGETLLDLIAENTAHGIMPPEWRAALAAAVIGGEPGVEVATIVGEVLADGLLVHALPPGDPRRQRALAPEHRLALGEPDGALLPHSESKG